MKLKFNKEGLEGEALATAKKLEENVTIEGGFTPEQVKEVAIKEIAELGLSKEVIAQLVKAFNEDNPEGVTASIKAVNDRMDKIVNERKEAQNANKTFVQIVGEGLNAQKEGLIGLKNKTSDKTRISIKAAGDENFDFGNFAGDSYANITTERRPLYQQAFAPAWLRNFLPRATTNMGTINYPRYTGEGDGAAGVWDGTGAIDALTSKPGVNFDMDDVPEQVKWIAGVTRVKREMLDDIAWLRSFITQQLLTGKRGLFVAENAQILSVLDAASVAYDGSNTLLIEQIYEAALGQMKDSYLNASLIIMNSRDSVNEVVLNKAQTSGLYNLPAGTVATVNDRLTIAGIPVLSLPEAVVPSGSAYVIDTNQTQFVSRMSPEITASDSDRDNFIKNLITFRAEERIATLVFDSNAVVKIGGATT